MENGQSIENNPNMETMEPISMEKTEAPEKLKPSQDQETELISAAAKQNGQSQAAPRQNGQRSVTPRFNGRTSVSPRPHGCSTEKPSTIGKEYLNFNPKTRDPGVILATKSGTPSEGTIKVYNTIPGLKNKKSVLLQEVAEIDSSLSDMYELKAILKKFSSKMKEFSAAIFKLERNRQGVPYVYNVKTLFQTIIKQLNAESIKKHIGQMNAKDVPFVMDLNVQFRNLSKLTEQIIVQHVNYHVTYLENFHWVAGKLRGMMKAIIALYYTDEAISDDFLDQSFDDLIIEGEVEKGSSEDGSDDEAGMPIIAPSPRTPFLLDSYEDNENAAKGIESVKELGNVRNLLGEANQILANIHRLSLGNPKIQSLRDYFGLVGDVLSGMDFTTLKLNEVPMISKLEATYTKIIRLSTLKRPVERHVEQMKLLLGELDGRVLILIKYVSSQ